MTNIEEQLTATGQRIVDEVVKPLLDDPPPPGQGLVESGVDSMTLVHILAQTEELFGVELPALDLMDDVSITGLAALVDERLDR